MNNNEKQRPATPETLPEEKLDDIQGGGEARMRLGSGDSNTQDSYSSVVTFTYTISDRNGGDDSAKASVTKSRFRGTR